MRTRARPLGVEGSDKALLCPSLTRDAASAACARYGSRRRWRVCPSLTRDAASAAPEFFWPPLGRGRVSVAHQRCGLGRSWFGGLLCAIAAGCPSLTRDAASAAKMAKYELRLGASCPSLTRDAASAASML